MNQGQESDTGDERNEPSRSRPFSDTNWTGLEGTQRTARNEPELGETVPVLEKLEILEGRESGWRDGLTSQDNTQQRNEPSVVHSMANRVVVAVIGLLGVTAFADTNSSVVTPDVDPLRSLAAAVPSVVQHCFAWEYSMTSCWKFLVLRATDGVINEAESSDSRPVQLLPGVVLLEADARRQDVENRAANEQVDSNNVTVEADLDKVLASRTERLLAGRHLSVFLAPGVSIKVSPSMQRNNDVLAADISVELSPGISVARMKMKHMSPIFLLPPLVFMGLMPFALAAIKGLIIKALMINQLAFSSAVWMTLRNMVFGPRPIVRYHNHGYHNHGHHHHHHQTHHFPPHKSSHVYHESTGPDHIADYSSQTYQTEDYSAEETHAAPGPPYTAHKYASRRPTSGAYKPFHHKRPTEDDYVADDHGQDDSSRNHYPDDSASYEYVPRSTQG